MAEECPECSREFESQRGVDSHIGHAHPGLKEKEVECAVCGDKKTIPNCQYEKADRFFCGSQCRSEWVSENNTGEANPSWNGGKVEVECENCGDTFKVTQALDGYRKHCSRSCYAEMQSEKYTGANASNFQGGTVTIECEVCADVFEVKRAREDVARFCSYDCMGEVYQDTMSGQDHPRWIEAPDPYYGPNWDERRKQRLEKDDYTCQDCGDSCENRDRNFPVHHITPIRDFKNDDGTYDYKTANEMSNLITLCISCHQKWEGLYLRPDTR
jgi:5-methylcytosine-specific restriction endonuclease McrA